MSQDGIGKIGIGPGGATIVVSRYTCCTAYMYFLQGIKCASYTYAWICVTLVASPAVYLAKSMIDSRSEFGAH